MNKLTKKILITSLSLSIIVSNASGIERGEYKEKGKLIEKNLTTNYKQGAIETINTSSKNENIDDIIKKATFTYKEEIFNKYKIIIESSDNIVSRVDKVIIDNKEQMKVSVSGAVFGDKYYPDVDNNTLYVDRLRDGNKIQLKDSNDKIIVTLEYKDKKLIKLNNDTKLDTLNVRIIGSFRPALMGEKKYDAISGATSGGVNSNKDSNVIVEATRAENPNENDFKKIRDLQIPGDKIRVKIVKDITGAEDSGMKGRVFESELTLSGVPKNEGLYKISVIVNENNKEYESNVLNLKIFNTQEQLFNRLNEAKKDEFNKLSHGDKKSWDMAPYEIKNFGGENETVTVPSELKLWWGSHKSGTYGFLGTSNQESNIKQRLIIDRDTDLNLINMIVKSNVDIIIKDGGKLNLNDSAVYGNIIVEKGGEFKMNHDEYNNRPLTGAAINGQLILNEGAILGDSLIYSNTNFLTDGGKNAKANKNDKPVVVVKGNININGRVFIRGDEEPTGRDKDNKLVKAQSALKVENGNVTLGKGAILALYGGGQSYNATNHNGGDALILDENTSITGDGLLIALGGNSHSINGKAGDAVSGSGIISTKEVYLEGGNNYSGGKVGKSHGAEVKIAENVIGEARDGENKNSSDNFVNPKYWNDIQAPKEKMLNPFSDIEIKKPINKYKKINEEKKDNKEDKKQISKEEKLIEKNSDDGQFFFNFKKVDKTKKESDKITQVPFMVGYPDKTLRPEENITRAEAISMIVRLLNVDLNNNDKTIYNDANSWYNKEINAATKLGILKEIANENLKPDAKITRSELVQILSHIDNDNNAKAPFTDIRGHKYEDAINKAYGNKIISGYKDNTFKPDANITRAEIAKILNDRFQRKINDKMREEFKNKFVDVKENHWAYDELVKATIPYDKN